MHVIQLGPFPPPEGGISRNMLAIREELMMSANSCSIIATSRSSRVGEEPDVYHPPSAFAVIKLLASLKFDILHLHIGGDVSPRVLALAFASSIFGRRKSVLTLHSGAYPQTEAALGASPNSIRGFIFRRFSRIIAVNDRIAEVFRRYGVAADRIKVILPYSPRRPDERVAIPNELIDFCKRHSPMLLSVGGLEKDYDPLFQIAVMKDILAEMPDAGLMIVGAGSMRGEIEQAVAQSGCAEKVHLAGNVDHAVTLHLIRDADVLLRTTLFDGDAISVREALFLGTPVIATDNGMRPEGVHLIEIGDSEALLGAVREIVMDGNRKEHVGDPDSSNITAVIEVYDQLTH